MEKWRRAEAFVDPSKRLDHARRTDGFVAMQAKEQQAGIDRVLGEADGEVSGLGGSLIIDCLADLHLDRFELVDGYFDTRLFVECQDPVEGDPAHGLGEGWWRKPRRDSQMPLSGSRHSSHTWCASLTSMSAVGLRIRPPTS